MAGFAILNENKNFGKLRKKTAFARSNYLETRDLKNRRKKEIDILRGGNENLERLKDGEKIRARVGKKINRLKRKFFFSEFGPERKIAISCQL